MSALGNLVVGLSLDAAQYTTGLDKASYEAQRFAQRLDKDINGAIRSAEKSLKGFAGSIIAGYASFEAASAYVEKFRGALNGMDDASKAAQKIGITTEALTSLQYAADLSDVSIEGLQNGLKKLNKAASEAASGNKEIAGAFRTLGVSVTDANGKIKSTDRLFSEVSDRFAGLSDGADKTTLAMAIFGKSGADLIPLLNSGADGLKAMADEAQSFGLVVGGEAAKAAEQFNDNLTRLQKSTDGLFKSMASAALPTLVEFSEKLVMATKISGSLAVGLQTMFNEAINSGDPSVRVRALNEELIAAKKSLDAYNGTNLKGTIFSFFSEKTLEQVKIQLQYNQELQNKLIDEANAPPENSAAKRQIQANKEAADEAVRSALAQAEAQKKAQEEASKAAEAYGKFVTEIKAKIAVQAEEAKLGREMTAAEKERFSQLQKLGQIGIQNKGVAASLIEQAFATAKLAEETKKLAAIDLEKSQAAQRVAEQDAQRIEAINKETESIVFQTQSLGLSKDKIAELTNQKDLDRIATLEAAAATAAFTDETGAATAAIEGEIRALQKRVGARRDFGAAEVANEQKKAYEDIYKDLSRGLTDSIFRGFEGGKKFITNFKDAIKNAFKSFLVKFAVQPIIGSVIGGVAGSLGLTGLAQAAQKELGGSGGFSGSGVSLSDFSSLKSVYDLVSKGFAGISGSVTNGIVRLGDYLATSSNGTLASAGDFINSGATSANGGVAGAAGGVAAYGAGISGGYAINRGLAGGYEVGGAVGNIAKNGALIGAIFGGPVGALIGGAIGGAVNGLFGKKTVLGAGGIEGTFTDDGFAGRTFQDVTVKRRFRSDRNSTSYGSVPTETLDAFAQTLMGISKAAKSAGLALGRDLTKGIETFSLSGRFTGSFESIANTVADAMVQSALSVYDQTTTTRGTGFARFFTRTTTKEVGTAENLTFLGYLRELKTASENLLQVMVRVAGAVTDANSAAILLGQGIQFSIANAREAVSFQSVLGDLTKNLESVLSSFIPAADLAARRVALMDEQLSSLGLDGLVSVKTTREEFGKLLQSRNITTESGQRELALLLQIAPAMDSIIRQREDELRQREDELNAIKQNILGQRQAVIDLFTGFADGIAQTRASLAAARNNTPEGTQSAFFDALTNVRSGNVDERAFGLSQISGAASAYLESATAAANSSLDAARIYGVVQSALIESENIARATADVQTLQLDALNAIAGGIIDVKNAILTGTDTNTVPGFANGGMFGGGLRMVGERGPELEITGPSRIIPNNQLSDVFGGSDNGKTADEVRALRQDMRASQAQMAAVNQKMLKILARWDADGQPETRVVA